MFQCEFRKEIFVGKSYFLLNSHLDIKEVIFLFLFVRRNMKQNFFKELKIKSSKSVVDLKYLKWMFF